MDCLRMGPGLFFAMLFACSSGSGGGPGGTGGLGGSAGSAGCDDDLKCNGVCADLETDAENCGECGRSCLGQPCEKGACVAQPLATATPQIVRMVADEDGLFWSSADAIFWLPPDGGTPTHLVTIDVPFAEIGLGPDHVYIAFEGLAGSLARVPKAGGALETVVANVNPTRFAVYAGNLYFSTSDGVHVVPEAGGTPTAIDPTPTPYLAVGDYGITGAVLQMPSQVIRMDLDGSNRTVLADIQGDADFKGPVLGLDSDGVDAVLTHRFTASGAYGYSGMVLRIPLAGGASTEVSGINESDLEKFDVSPRAVCWTTRDVYSYCHDRDAAESRVLVKVEGYQLIALTEAYAYLARESGEIVRVAY